MSEQINKIVLSKPTEFVLRGGVTLKVFPASLETISQLEPKLKQLDEADEDTGKNLKDQVAIFTEVVHGLVKDDNDIQKDALKKVLTVEACTKIIQIAMGSLGDLAG